MEIEPTKLDIERANRMRLCSEALLAALSRSHPRIVRLLTNKNGTGNGTNA